ncbi:hypothetical protein M758_11G155400 [Ceratodon purpureus]|nr:hypothetical protein M758_11G155400 [Ceratodon purpureus]
MVMLFPDTADRSSRYGTTNASYGNFYGTVIREVNRLNDFDWHHECNKQGARLVDELEEAKAALQMVDWQYARAGEGQFAPRGACCLKERMAPHSRCQCDHRTPGCYENPYKLGSEVAEPDCGQSREPEFLEDHVRAYHPRLAPKLQVLPKCCSSRLNRCDLRTGSVLVRPVGSGGGFGVGLQAGLHGRGHRKPKKMLQSCSAGPPPLPMLLASQRYGYYRYYGAAGQGAKTSADWQPRP